MLLAFYGKRWPWRCGEEYMNQDYVNKSVLVLIVFAISALFLSMIHPFVMAIFLAGLFSAMARPVYRRLKIRFNGRRHLASVTTLMMMIVIVLIPLMLLVGLVVAQAIDVGQSVTPWVKQNLEQPDELTVTWSNYLFTNKSYPTAKSSSKKRGSWSAHSATGSRAGFPRQPSAPPTSCS